MRLVRCIFIVSGMVVKASVVVTDLGCKFRWRMDERCEAQTYCSGVAVKVRPDSLAQLPASPGFIPIVTTRPKMEIRGGLRRSAPAVPSPQIRPSG